jgi:hypothetical protein
MSVMQLMLYIPPDQVEFDSYKRLVPLQVAHFHCYSRSHAFPNTTHEINAGIEDDD